ncbi:MAG: response regulator [Sandaracinaceae bacterium]
MATVPHILVVDDNVDLAENLAEALELAGASVDIAANGREALRRVEESAYDLVLTDMRMPEVSGLDLIRSLRAQDPATPVIVMTAYTKGSELDEARDRGALDILEKPIDLGALDDLVDRLRAPLRVLVVEDDTTLRTNLTEALYGVDHVVPFTAATAAEARSVTERLRPRIVVLDLRLPDQEDLGLLHQLRAIDGVEVIVTTGYPSDVVSDGPPTLILEKPFAIATLIEHVRGLA